jgi:hypothetical protein
MTFKQITWWPGAYHVYDGDKRLGVVNERVVRTARGAEKPMWFAHDVNFFNVGKEFPNRKQAANALPKNGKAAKRTANDIAGL